LVYSLYIATIATPVNKKKQKKQKKIRQAVAPPPVLRALTPGGNYEQLYWFPLPWGKKNGSTGETNQTRAACWPAASAHFQLLEL